MFSGTTAFDDKYCTGLVKKVIDSNTSLSAEEAEYLFDYLIKSPEYSYQFCAVLAVMKNRGETPEEILGLYRVISKRMKRIALDVANTVDVGGTGGGASTFNISTAAAFILAASGVKVCKHGNNKVSSLSGSFDVLNALGINVEALSSPEIAEKTYEAFGITFLTTRNYHNHPDFLMDMRKRLAISTMFNIIGPLLNPACVPFQIIGVSHQKMMEPMVQILLEQRKKGFMLVHGMEGIDELSPCGPTSVVEYRNGCLKEYILHPSDFGITPVDSSFLTGGLPQENAQILKSIFRNEVPEKVSVVLPTVAAALYICGAVDNLPQGIKKAKRTLYSGKANILLHNLQEALK